ncbi:MAG: AAA family ATPase [Bacteroidales bacterium]|nr:AAA family ATPase [Bacteroidales bacterium]
MKNDQSENADALNEFQVILIKSLRDKGENRLGIILHNLKPKLKNSIKETYPEYKDEKGNYNWLNLINEKIQTLSVKKDDEYGDVISEIQSSVDNPTNETENGPTQTETGHSNNGLSVSDELNTNENSTFQESDTTVSTQTVTQSTQSKLNILLKNLLEELNNGLYEKERAIRLTLLATLAGESTFMLGEPGTAKSLVARRVSEAFEEPTEESGVVKFFDYLMNQFSQPDEIFGPISINELKNDKYVRKTDGFLPKAQFAFLDEIWKANPAIQNALLTILNERIYRNGTKIESVPLIGFMSASNELPEKGLGLDAIYDRFLIRLLEKPISDQENFRKMIAAEKKVTTNITQKLTKELIDEIQKDSESVEISDECYDIIDFVRKQITLRNSEIQDDNEKFLVSDRRWKKIVNLMRVSAYCNNRIETNIMDATLIADCIWRTEQQEKDAKQIVCEAIEKHGLKYSDDYSTYESGVDTFKKDVDQNFFNKISKGGTPITKTIENKIFYQIETDNNEKLYISKDPTTWNSREYYQSDDGRILRSNLYGQWDDENNFNEKHTTYKTKKKSASIEYEFKDGFTPEQLQVFIDHFNKKKYTPLQKKLNNGKDTISKHLKDSERKFGNNIFANTEQYLPIIENELRTAKANIEDLIEKLDKEKARYETHI